MAKKKISITESLVVIDTQLFTVAVAFKGIFNLKTFNCKVGDTVMLNKDEQATYSRFLKKD